jgi:hypothetical protein
MRVLALDQSILACGWALWETGWALPRCGVWELAGGLKHAGKAFVRLQRNIMAFHQEEPLDEVASEEVILVGTDKIDKLVALYGLKAHVMSFCEATGVRHSSTRDTRWRRHFIPPSNSTDWKWLAEKRCRELGIEVPDHNAAEACGLLAYRLDALGIQPPWAKTGALL